jgi:7-carboxy-7-deazaguanine synthase
MNRQYPLAPNAVFHTIQGEGALLGVPMRFIRLGGCSVGCPGCDTDYRVTERATATEIAARVAALPLCDWSFVTGGEPADHDLWPLLEELRLLGRVALVTSGSRPLRAPFGLIDFLTVSPHETPDKLVLTRGSQVNLVPGLNGMRLEDWAGFDFSGFAHRYVTPLADSASSLSACLDWLAGRSGWRLGVQAHKIWGLP